MNQYQHIRFEWGGRGPDLYDCIGLADLVRRQGGMPPIDFTQLEWIYKKHPTLDDSPLDLVAQLAQILGHETPSPEDYSIAIVKNMDGRSNVGTVMGNAIVAFMGDRVRAVPIERLRSTLNGIRFFTIAESLLQANSVHF